MATRRATPNIDKKLLRSVRDTAFHNLSWKRETNSNLFIDNSVHRKASRITTPDMKVSMRRDTVMVFEDEYPRLNWMHPCRYLLFDAKTGEKYKEIKANFPPYMTDIPETFKPFHEPIPVLVPEKPWYVKPRFRCPIRIDERERYAILFSGASNNRHTNDLEFLYRTLRNVYGYKSENIYVLNYDGTINYSGSPQPVNKWPGDNAAYQMTVNAAGTKSELDAVFNDLKTRLTRRDSLLIHTNNHGGHNGTESYLCTYSGASYKASDFGAKLATLPKHDCMIVMMEQCHSGGFNQPIVDNSPAKYTSVASACVELNSSIGGANFDPFARDWIAAMNGSNPSGSALASNPDTNGNGIVTAGEAFNFADSIHHSYDTPVFDENTTYASECHLGRRFYIDWYCRRIYEILKPEYIRLPEHELMARIHQNVVPILEKHQDTLDKKTDSVIKEIAADLDRQIPSVMKKKAKAGRTRKYPKSKVIIKKRRIN